ncbi:hypothetical protein KKH38_01035 [Patescibacteria group bacterium]|nr:hypothetical protein [Patescibacteria group bacterium]MBU4600446.1 hypothetical protein [Patescibacteria group bacterium]
MPICKAFFHHSLANIFSFFEKRPCLYFVFVLIGPADKDIFMVKFLYFNKNNLYQQVLMITSALIKF